MTSPTGLLLAAGAGRRFGRPKALVDDWLATAVTALREGGCGEVVVVVGAQAEAVITRVEQLGADYVVAPDWERGMGASLRSGLAVLAASPAEAALVHLVDLPDVGAEVIARLVELSGPRAVARATYEGRPGHPVLLGRTHWSAAAEAAMGDRGARDYLSDVGPDLVECGDLATGRDCDYEPDRTPLLSGEI